ncbi:MAG: cytochrome C [Paludibacter sp.]|nr:cytochrome C [Paludibacter sp.]
MNLKHILLILSLTICGFNLRAQISPGELSNAHSDLDGVSNCTKCHSVGNKVTNEKCLDCHKEIKANIISKKGYHASSEVTSKQCAACHNDHHGRNFQMIRLDKKTFVHEKTGFSLKGAHAKQDCKACHKPAFIKDARLKQKTTTYFGLNQECLSCHADHHKGKMSPKCTNCHNFDSFKNATGFDHNTTRFPLLGKHKGLVCEKCHVTETIGGQPKRRLRAQGFANCNSCHKDVHENKFGQNCKQCHSEDSFRNVKGLSTFDHDKTGFKLIGKHKNVACKSCHKVSLTAPLKHDKCSDCHTDYHKKEFVQNNIAPDCNQCHTNEGFSPSIYTIEKHNLTKFPLEGGHKATPCISCHKKTETWTFRKIGSRCIDCHKNEHKGFIQEKYFPNQECTVCHNVETWKKVKFDHSKTNFKLDGAHANLACSQCHYLKNEKGIRTQKFIGLSMECGSCHKDSHQGQFEINGKTECGKCHGTESWKNTKYDHNTSRFKLSGAHLKAKCGACHKEITDEKGKYVQYKFKNIECSNCHS